MKDGYISYVLEEYLADGNFDAFFAGSWIDETQLEVNIPAVCDYAFAQYGIDADGKYAETVARLFKDMIAYNAIAREGDDYAGNWYRLRPAAKTKFVTERRASNPVASRLGTLGAEALQRALAKIAAEDGLRSMEEKWAADNQAEDRAEDALNKALAAGPKADFFKSEARKQSFSDVVERAIVEVEGSTLSNSDKAQAHGYLSAARALSDTPDPPVDLIWSILSRANNVAGIGSFFLALITLIAMVAS